MSFFFYFCLNNKENQRGVMHRNQYSYVHRGNYGTVTLLSHSMEHRNTPSFSYLLSHPCFHQLIHRVYNLGFYKERQAFALVFPPAMGCILSEIPLIRHDGQLACLPLMRMKLGNFVNLQAGREEGWFICVFVK